MKVHLIGECNSFQNHGRNFSEANGVLVPQAFKKIRYFSFWTRSSLLLLFLYWFSPGSSTAPFLTFQRTWLGICGSVTTCQWQLPLVPGHSSSYWGLHIFQGRNLSVVQERASKEGWTSQPWNIWGWVFVHNRPGNFCQRAIFPISRCASNLSGPTAASITAVTGHCANKLIFWSSDELFHLPTCAELMLHWFWLVANK